MNTAPRLACLVSCIAAFAACANDSTPALEDAGRARDAGSDASDAGSDASMDASDTTPAQPDAHVRPTAFSTFPDYEAPRPRGDAGDVIVEPEDEAAAIFDQATLRTYDVIIAPSDLEQIDAMPAAETYVTGMLEVDGESHGPVGIRYKGSVGAFLSPCTSMTFPGLPAGAKTGKCSMKIAFDHIDPEGRFFGLRKLNFHSMNQDDSLMRDRLGYAMFREMGVAAPRAVHARVLINGQLEGLFALVEQIDGRFTRSRFSEGGEGNLYKEIWPVHSTPSAYLSALETNEDEMPDVTSMLSFAHAIDTGADETLDWIDRDYSLRYIAVDRVIINDDGAFHFWCTELGQGNNPGGVGNHNYYWYQASDANRFWLVPWDLDNAFDVGSIVHIEPEWTQPARCVCTGAGLQRPPACDPLVAHWKSWHDDYLAMADTFIDGPFAAANVDAKLDAWTAQIAATVAEAAGQRSAPTVAEWEAAVTLLRSTIAVARGNRGYPY